MTEKNTIQPFAAGDIFAGATLLNDPKDDHAGPGRIIQYDAQLKEKGVLWTKGTTHLVGGLTFGPDGNLWAFDSNEHTVVRVSPSGKTIWIQEDTAVLDGWKAEFVAGGFAGHCSNNNEQTYKYSPNPDGHVHRASRRKDGWFRTTNGEPVIPGRHQFHDYNF